MNKKHIQRGEVGGYARHTRTKKNHNFIENFVFSGSGSLLYLSFPLRHHPGWVMVMVALPQTPAPPHHNLGYGRNKKNALKTKEIVLLRFVCGN